LLFIVAPLILTAIFTRPIPSSLRRFAPNFLQSTSVSTSTIAKPTMSASNIKFTPRKSEERGGANHGWLKTFHTFSFANYQDEAFEQYGPLRVINEGELSLRRLSLLVEREASKLTRAVCADDRPGDPDSRIRDARSPRV
jgi:hypothetical protein